MQKTGRRGAARPLLAGPEALPARVADPAATRPRRPVVDFQTLFIQIPKEKRRLSQNHTDSQGKTTILETGLFPTLGGTSRKANLAPEASNRAETSPEVLPENLPYPIFLTFSPRHELSEVPTL